MPPHPIAKCCVVGLIDLPVALITDTLFLPYDHWLYKGPVLKGRVLDEDDEGNFSEPTDSRRHHIFNDFEWLKTTNPDAVDSPMPPAANSPQGSI